MWTTRLSVLLSVALIVAPAAMLARSPASIHACSIGSFGTPERQLMALLDAIQDDDIVLVGDVVDERRIGKVKDKDVYLSDVRSKTVLQGHLAEADVAVRTQAFESKFCSGTSRLLKGEQVLLVLDWKATGGGLEGEPPEAWTLSHFLGKVLLNESEAVSQYANQGMPIGTPEEIIRTVGAAVMASPEKIEAAVAVASESRPESGSPEEGQAAASDSRGGSGGTFRYVVAGVGATIPVVAGGLWLVRRRWVA